MPTCAWQHQILDVLDEIAERTHNIRYKIEILALRALALDAAEILWPGGNRRSDRSAKTGGRPVTAGRLHPGFCRPGKTHAGDAAPACQTRLFGGEDQLHPGGISRDDKSLNGTKPAQSAPIVRLQFRHWLSLDPPGARDSAILRGPASIKEIAMNLNISYETVSAIQPTFTINWGQWALERVARAEELTFFPHARPFHLPGQEEILALPLHH